jgi:putative ABC transport system permease protein
MLSVVFNGDASQLSALRAMSEGYPLRGKVLISTEPFGPQEVATSIPAPGEAWPESRLAVALGASIGMQASSGSPRS